MAKKKVEELTIEEKLNNSLIPVDKQPYEIPKNWCWVKLEALSSEKGFFDGDWILSEDMDKNGNIRLIQLADIGKGNFLNKSKKFINEDVFNKLNCKEIFPNDLLIARMPEPIARSCIVPFLSNKLITVVDVAVFRYNKILLNNKFANYLCNTPYFNNLANNKARGSTRQRITRRHLGELPFPLPPLAEQERIVNKLDNYISKLDEAKEKLEKVVDSYNYRKNLILHRAFIGQLTKNWRKENNISFDDWKEFLLKDILLPMTSKKPKGEYFRYIDIDSIDNEFQEVKEPKYIQTEKASSRANRELKTGDVIFSLVRPYLRNIAFIDETLSDCIASTGFYVCRANKEIIPEYLYKFLCFDKTIGYLNKFMRGFNSPSIRNNDLLNMPITLPPLEEQKEIVKILDSVLSKEKQVKEIAEKEIERVEDLKKNLLTRAFGGVLGTNDPNEENSIELLKSVL